MLPKKTTKIIPALQSRCTRFKFLSVKNDMAVERVKEICQTENLNLSLDVIQELCKVSKGDMRKCINTLQSVFLNTRSGTEEHSNHPNTDPAQAITVDHFYRIIGSISPEELNKVFSILISHNFTESRESTIIRSKEGFKRV